MDAGVPLPPGAAYGPAALSPPMQRAHARRIAAAFAPPRLLGNRHDQYYVRAKLGSDPLYPGVCAALRDSTQPLLDLGCGLGLLAHALRADGSALPYRGVDFDAGKIARARLASARAGLDAATFECIDLAAPEFDPAGLAHRGSVALLDVLQFVPPAAQARVLDAAVAMLVPGARLVIRTGLDDGSARARITRAVDRFSRRVGWMNAGPDRYPEPEALRARFAAAGLASEFTPLHGRTPFNNWRVLAWLPGPATAGAPAAG